MIRFELFVVNHPFLTAVTSTILTIVVERLIDTFLDMQNHKYNYAIGKSDPVQQFQYNSGYCTHNLWKL